MLTPVLSPRGIPASAVSGFLKALADHDYRIHGLIIWQHGQLCYADAAAPYTLQSPHRLFSSAKSILVLAALKAVEQGKLSLTDKVVSFFPEYPAAPGVENMTVKDLLTMRSGQEGDPFGLLFQDFDADLIRAFLATPTDDAPGGRFRYNNTIPHMICAVTARAVGMPFPDYMAQYFTGPLDAPIAAPTNPQGIYNPVVTTMSMESFFKYALLFHQGGVTEAGARLLPEALVRTALAEHTPTGLPGNSAGYGYQIWRNAFGGSRMDGGWGQFAFLLPAEDACVVVLSDMTDCAYCITAFEECLLPALQGEAVTESQPDVRLHSIAPCGERTPDADILEAAWRFPDGSILTVAEDGEDLSVTVSGDHPYETRIGMKGTFRTVKRYLSRPTVSIDQTVYGVDNMTLSAAGAWSTPRCLDVVLKCFGEMGEYACRLAFDKDTVQVWRHETAQHGIADPLTGILSEGVRVCKTDSGC